MQKTNKHYNSPMRKTLSLILSALMLTLSACKRDATGDGTHYFRVLEKRVYDEVLYDPNTMVMYAHSFYGGYIVLVDSTGKPLTWKGGDR